jgi:validoxylamine A glucosyltransferase
MFDISVVVPTFQRAQFLRQTLDSLLRQTLEKSRFEVVVADDGSSDGTTDVVSSFSRSLSLQYLYHHDLGHRVAAPRNTGAKAASAPLVVFLDAGTIASPGFLAAHVDAHRAFTGRATVVVGRVLGYNNNAFSEKAEGLSGDMRDSELDRFARTLGNIHLPWRLAWTVNLSVDATSFHSVGGFDERFTGWGAEDMELAYRLHREDAYFYWSDEAYALEHPHPRDMPSNIASNIRNLKLFHEIHPYPEVEIFMSARKARQDVHDSIAEYCDWVNREDNSGDATPQSDPSDMAPLLGGTATFGRIPLDKARVLINPFGISGDISKDVRVHRAVGLNTRLPDKCFSIATIQVAHYGQLWERWKGEITEEANRLARVVNICDDHGLRS